MHASKIDASALVRATGASGRRTSRLRKLLAMSGTARLKARNLGPSLGQTGPGDGPFPDQTTSCTMECQVGEDRGDTMRLIQELARRPKRSVGAVADAELHEGAGSGSGMGFTQTSTIPNIFGGRDEYQNGVLVSQSRPNVFGGFDKNVFSLHGTGDGHALEHVESALADILGYRESSE